MTANKRKCPSRDNEKLMSYLIVVIKKARATAAKVGSSDILERYWKSSVFVSVTC